MDKLKAGFNWVLGKVEDHPVWASGIIVAETVYILYLHFK